MNVIRNAFCIRGLMRQLYFRSTRPVPARVKSSMHQDRMKCGLREKAFQRRALVLSLQVRFETRCDRISDQGPVGTGSQSGRRLGEHRKYHREQLVPFPWIDRWGR